MKIMRIESKAFLHKEKIPSVFTCDGEGSPVPLKIFGVPEHTQSLVLIVDDPDAPNKDFVHWLVWNINPKTVSIEGTPSGSIEGYTSLNKQGWVPPCPPTGIHHYNFRLFALDTVLSKPESSTKKDILEAMEGHIIESSTLVGLYERI